MALPFYQLLGIDLADFPDGGIYDPDTGISFVGPEAKIPTGEDPNTVLVEDVETGNPAGEIDPTRTKRFVSGKVENTYTATDGRTFTNIDEYIEHQNAIYASQGGGGGGGGGGGNTGGFTTGEKNAREFIMGVLRQYFGSSSDAKFVTELGSLVDGYIKQGYDADTILVLLPQSAPYKERFKGNEGRIAAGLSALSPAEYLQAEETYNDILTRYNLGSVANRDVFSSLISGQVSAAELTDRVVNVYDRIRNADPALKAELDRVKELSGGQLGEADFAKALLTGDIGANELKRKIAIAEISAEARTRNLSVSTATELQQLGVTRAEAQAGFENIAQIQPTYQKLGGIYDRNVMDAEATQRELEQEQFQGLESKRRKRLAQQEIAAFSGSSGAFAGTLGKRKPAGQI